MLSDCFHLPLTGQVSQLRSLYSSLLFECLSALMSGVKVEVGGRDADRATTMPVAETDIFSPPPFKKARLADECPYRMSDFDLLLQLDDGTVVPANREAVAGGEASQKVSSEYFRALLRGGFGESLAEADKAIPIRGVSEGMLLPVLHYLHGCRLAREHTEGGRRGRCQVLDDLVLKGLGQPSSEDLGFQTTPVGQMMMGASRFLVGELQSESEDLCVSLLLSRSSKAARKGENPEDHLVDRTSELELTGEGKDAAGQRKPESGLRHRGDVSLDPKTIKNIPVCDPGDAAVLEEPLGPEEPTQDRESTLLPQLYWFSQLYSYPALGRACLSLLLGQPQLFSSSSAAGDCLLRLAAQGGSTETLKKDLLGLATAALSGPDRKGC